MPIGSPKMPRRRLLFPIKSLAVVVIVAIILLLFSSDANAVRSPSSIAGQKHHSRNKNSSNLLKHDSSISPTTEQESTTGNDMTFEAALPRGGASLAKKQNAAVTSMYWAVLHNWLYFLSLGFNLLNIPYMIREIVDGSATATPSPQSIALSGNVEAVDKILTFCGIAFLATLSDRFGRKPLIAWSSFGFAVTNLLQAFAGKAPTIGASKAILYFADIIDGCTSCMTPVCQAYVADCTAAAAASGVSVASLATNLGIFQGISIGGAFVIAFPVGGLLGAKYGPRFPILLSAGVGIVNGLLATFVTPESNLKAIKDNQSKKSKSKENNNKIRLSEVNPITGLQKLMGVGTNNIPGFGTSSVSLLRTASLTYFLLSLARGSLDAQFVNYSNLRFGWTQAQSGPVLVMIGFMLAIVPRILVPLLGLQNSINYGLLVYATGLVSAGLVSKSAQFVASIAIVAIGCVSIPALQALLANLSSPGQSGALLGAVSSMTELTGAIGSSMYATILATFAISLPSSSKSTVASSIKSVLPDIPGMHFLVGASFALIGWVISSRGLKSNPDHPALAMKLDKAALAAAAAAA